MSENSKKYRLITRSDFDGLVCTLLFMHLEMINDVTFVHPKDMQDGKVEVSDSDVSTNLPYVDGIHLAFDHHLSETMRVGSRENHIIDPDAPSASRVVYNYYGGKERFPDIPDDLMEAVDKADSAQYTMEEVLNPTGWVLLSFIMDARSGFGRFRNFRISNYQLMLDLVLQSGAYTINEILNFPDVQERIKLYKEHEEKAKKQIKDLCKVYNNLVVIDFRDVDPIYVTNRFMIYALFPQCNISIHVMWGRQKLNTVFAIGKSIFKRDSNTNIGELALEYNGGGHANAGTCQVDNDLAEKTLQELIDKISKDG